MTVLEYVALGVAGAACLAVLTEKAAAFFRARGNTKVADELDVAHELLHVVVQVLDGHEHGVSVGDAVVAAVQSPEAKDLLRRVQEKARAS